MYEALGQYPVEFEEQDLDDSEFELCPPGATGCTDEGQPITETEIASEMEEASETDLIPGSDADFNHFDGDYSDSAAWNTTSSHDPYSGKLTLP